MTKNADQRAGGNSRDRAASTTRSSRPVHLPTQDRDLMAQNQQFDVFGRRRHGAS